MLPSSNEPQEGDAVDTPLGTATVLWVTDLQVGVRFDDGRTGSFFKANVEVVTKR